MAGTECAKAGGVSSSSWGGNGCKPVFVCSEMHEKSCKFVKFDDLVLFKAHDSLEQNCALANEHFAHRAT